MINMVKERLSKLQKWILEKCLNELEIYYQGIYKFFGKKYTVRKPETFGKGFDFKKHYGDKYEEELDIENIKREWPPDPDFPNGFNWEGYKINPKKEFCITNSEKVVISRSLKGLIKKGFLIQIKKWGEYRLTEKGFLKANKFLGCCSFVNFKEYQKEIDNITKKKNERIREMNEFIKRFKR